MEVAKEEGREGIWSYNVSSSMIYSRPMLRKGPWPLWKATPPVARGKQGQSYISSMHNNTNGRHEAAVIIEAGSWPKRRRVYIGEARRHSIVPREVFVITGRGVPVTL